MKKTFIIGGILITIFLLVACANPSQDSIQAAETKIYSLLLNDICKNRDENHPPTFIYDETRGEQITNNELILENIQIILHEPAIKKQTLDNYRANNKQPKLLRESLITQNSTCKFIGKDDLAILEKENENWRNEHMLISFSTIGLNSDLNQALVYTEYSCGGECAGGDLYFLVYKDNIWSIKTTLLGWRS